LLARFLPEPYFEITRNRQNLKAVCRHFNDPRNLYVYSLLEGISE
jgi:hypothetical protein